MYALATIKWPQLCREPCHRRSASPEASCSRHASTYAEGLAFGVAPPRRQLLAPRVHLHRGPGHQRTTSPRQPAPRAPTPRAQNECHHPPSTPRADVSPPRRTFAGGYTDGSPRVSLRRRPFTATPRARGRRRIDRFL